MTDLLTIIREKQADKESRHFDPIDVTFREIMEVIGKEVKDELNNYVKDGTLEFHRTINDISFNIKSK